MRTWRVGTISMGLALLSLGIFLLISQVASLDLTKVMLAWWPVILIVLGLEILIYLFMNRKEKPMLKYDFLSIIFVGIIGMTGIIFATLSSAGVLDLVEEAIGREQQTYELPAFSEKIDANVKRVVVDMAAYPFTVESTGDNAVSVFGTYSAWTKNNKPVLEKAEDYLAVQKKGDTLYVTVKNLPESRGALVNSNAYMEGTLLIPDTVQLELAGEWSQLTVKPRTLKNDWRINNFSNVTVHLPNNSDVEIAASHARELRSDSGKWQVSEVKKISTVEVVQQGDGVVYAEDFDQDRINGVLKMGEGTHTIHLSDINTVNVKTN